MAIEIVDFPINSMVIFHSYVKLPEGMCIYIHDICICIYVYNHPWLVRLEFLNHMMNDAILLRISKKKIVRRGVGTPLDEKPARFGQTHM